MTMRDSTHLLRKLNPHCASALEGAASLCQARLASEITLEHWLLKLIEVGDGDIPAILRRYEIDIDGVWDALLAAIDRAPRDLRGKPSLSRSLSNVLESAWLYASAGDATQPIRSANLLQSITDAPHLLRATDAWPLLSVSSTQIQRLLPELDLHSVEGAQQEEPPAEDDAHASASASGTGAPQLHPTTEGANGKRPSPPRAVGRSTQGEALARFAIDLTEKARRGEIDPVFGRDREIQQTIDVLARRRKNNPIEPGVGKTALVEGLALRVAEGSVPNVIRDVRILTLDLGLLQAGAGVKGEFEQRLKNVIEEVQASPAPVLLFIDEAHTIIGAGNAAGGADAANLLKPALARGELRTIAATTWAEYKEYFERDAALERRFQLIKVDEPDDAAACLMLRGLASRYAKYHNVHIRDEALVAAVKLSRRYIPARQLPDKAVDLIDTAAARVRMGLESPPAELQRAQASVAALELEVVTLDADRKAGIEDGTARHEALTNALYGASAELDSLRAKYGRELESVNALLAQREASRDGQDDHSRDALDAARRALADAQGKTPLILADVDAQAIARVVAEWTGVPVGNLVDDELRSLLAIEQSLATRVVAQDDALTALAESLRTAKAGLRTEHAPLGVFLLAGPSGVGKTETALALADLLFGGEAALTTINMSEYQESHTVSQLKGSPPGYVGYGRGGVLTEAVRQRPYSVVLLDEVEKAHRDVLDIFYQVFDRGTMRDGEGREIDFRNCVILMTSNLGSAEIDEATAENPAISQGELLEAIYPSLVAHFQPALLARFQTLAYRPLDAPALESIVQLKVGKVAERLRRQHDVALTCDEALTASLAQLCLARESGARNVDAFLNQRILPAVSRELLTRMANGSAPAEIRLSMSAEGNLIIDFVDRADGEHDASVTLYRHVPATEASI
ncbi:type VI secretion system ATPase TssH [Paraburkholderia sediminicola]|uniref:type VI secretion system ATPase TssH n=1 Tax=Paraburkholderia sediminicola TaxID=458836 RepID=UPI000E731393